MAGAPVWVAVLVEGAMSLDTHRHILLVIAFITTVGIVIILIVASAYASVILQVSH